MLNYSDFRKADIRETSSFKETLELCKAIRQSGDKKPYVIRIRKTEEEGTFRFPYSDFMLEFEKGSLLKGNHYGNEYDASLHMMKTTWHTAVLTVTGNNNIFINLQVQNTALNPKVKGTSIAVSLFGKDNLFVKCDISSTQDTLFLGPLPDDLVTRYLGFIPEEERLIQGNLRNYFMNTRIAGSVDFIFGAGQGVFHNCLIETVKDGRNGDNYICAPAHSLKDDFGFVFADCSFIGPDDQVESTYLARPWRDYGKVCFINCTYNKHIKKEGFSDWSKSAKRYLTARFEEFPLEKGRVRWVFNSREKQEILNNYLEEIKKI